MTYYNDNNDIELNQAIDDDADFIPLLSSEDEDTMQNEKVPDILPILPLRNTVLFPGVVIPITVGRDKSIQLIKDYNKGDKTIGVVAQISDSIEDPTEADLHKTGTVAFIIKMLRMPNGDTTIIIQGKNALKLPSLFKQNLTIKQKYKRLMIIALQKQIKNFKPLFLI